MARTADNPLPPRFMLGRKWNLITAIADFHGEPTSQGRGMIKQLAYEYHDNGWITWWTALAIIKASTRTLPVRSPVLRRHSDDRA